MTSQNVSDFLELLSMPSCCAKRRVVLGMGQTTFNSESRKTALGVPASVERRQHLPAPFTTFMGVNYQNPSLDFTHRCLISDMLFAKPANFLSCLACPSSSVIKGQLHSAAFGVPSLYLHSSNKILYSWPSISVSSCRLQNFKTGMRAGIWPSGKDTSIPAWSNWVQYLALTLDSKSSFLLM